MFHITFTTKGPGSVLAFIFNQETEFSDNFDLLSLVIREKQISKYFGSFNCGRLERG